MFSIIYFILLRKKNSRNLYALLCSIKTNWYPLIIKNVIVFIMTRNRIFQKLVLEIKPINHQKTILVNTDFIISLKNFWIAFISIVLKKFPALTIYLSLESLTKMNYYSLKYDFIYLCIFLCIVNFIKTNKSGETLNILKYSHVFLEFVSWHFELSLRTFKTFYSELLL